MNNAYYSVRLDTHLSINQGVVQVKRGDNARSLCFTLTDGGNPYRIVPGTIATLYAMKPDGTIIYNACTIEGNVIVCNMTTQTVAAVGIVECEVRLTDAQTRVLTSPRFAIHVVESVYDDSVPESQNEFTQLTAAIAQVSALIAPPPIKIDFSHADDPTSPYFAVQWDEDEAEQHFALTYDAQGNLIKVTSPAGDETVVVE